MKYWFHLADALKTGQKVAENARAQASEKFDEAKQAGETLRKRASDAADDL